ncbi:GNAT family N-acetyltransferase [Psychrosphaera haliotis]|uniref:GNAT family N-acetyltransferase n=1 Tax=Psychrosphaera haliotis TaxID=555083 RepID=A0A6N8F9V0_9GAMM|nr:GNAT family N-acetyltransferase [Psychrosphaera haliotis]MUH73213.1 GNAT family N-acetyltransferase [Psychrosphaera haliotis]
MISKTTKEHKEELQKVLTESGQFDADSIAYTLETLDNHLENPDDEIWFTALENEPVGFAYCAPEPVTSGTWNLLMLWTKEGYKGKGFGRSLVSAVESELKSRGARLLIVETSQLPEFETARAFYEKYGFTFEAEVKNFFADGDNKLIYTKSQG